MDLQATVTTATRSGIVSIEIYQLCLLATDTIAAAQMMPLAYSRNRAFCHVVSRPFAGETWMYPALLLWHPNVAQSLLQYRINNVKTAEAKAASYNDSYTGAMFPWESAATGRNDARQHFLFDSV